MRTEHTLAAPNLRETFRSSKTSLSPLIFFN